MSTRTELSEMPGLKPGPLGVKLALPCLRWPTGLWDSAQSTAVLQKQMSNPPAGKHLPWETGPRDGSAKLIIAPTEVTWGPHLCLQHQTRFEKS